MNTRTQERVERWESRAFSGGYEGLRDLADSDFTGAVNAAGAWLFMLNGRVVGVYEGSIEDFEGASGTAHVAPDPALPLLFAMWEEGGETQGKYYTEDTAVSEVDDTLSSGSFTGYLELSENVLSGDYYVVYYGGRSMSAAFVGNKEELIGGDEAFERADDEVGIYEVLDVDVDVVDIPEPAGADGGAAESAAGTGPVDDAAGTESVGDAPADGAGGPSTDESVTAGAVEDVGSSGTDASAGSDSVEDRPGPTADDPASDRREASATDADAADRIAGYEDVEFDDDGRLPDDADAGDPTPADDGIPDDVVDDSIRDEPVGDGITDDPVDDGISNEPVDDGIPNDVVDDAVPDDSVGDADASTESVGAAADRTEPVDDERSGPREDAAVREAEPARDAASQTDAADAGDDTGDKFEDEVDWQNVKTVPSLDPDHSATPGPDEGTASASGGTASGGASTAGSASTSAGSSATGGAPSSTGTTAGSSAASSGRSGRRGRSGPESGRGNGAGRTSGATNGRTSGADADGPPAGGRRQSRDRQTADSGPSQADLEERDERIETLEGAVQRVREERDQLRAERDRLDEDNDSLRDEIAQLEGEIERLESEVRQLEGALADAGKTAHDADTQLHPSEAIAGTNLFVRYRSKGDATLESAHAGDADAAAVNENVRLERHTTFDAASAAVQGKPFDDYLTTTLEYRFVTWVVETLLYEIRETGHAGGLKDLYDAIPQIDRAELGGEVDIVYEEDGEQITERAAFDVVLRDRMGNPLLVADLNDSRDPATESMLVELESAASRIKRANEELSAAFLVTSSFFEPGALEAVAEATSGSLLSRDSRESFVKQSRKQGYHLCLVEARADDFHMNVPEL